MEPDRARWRAYQGRIDPRRLIFIDETWTKTNMTRPFCGWAASKGERLVDKAPQGKWKTATFLAALRNDRIDAPCSFDGPINGERFRAYVEQFLVPTLKPGDAVILDNPGSPQGEGGAEGHLGKLSATRLVFLPKYSRPQPHRAGLRQVRNSAARRPKPEATRRSPTQAVKSSPSTRPPNAPHTSRTQDTGKAKCRKL